MKQNLCCVDWLEFWYEKSMLGTLKVQVEEIGKKRMKNGTLRKWNSWKMELLENETNWKVTWETIFQNKTK